MPILIQWPTKGKTLSKIHGIAHLNSKVTYCNRRVPLLALTVRRPDTNKDICAKCFDV